MSEPALSDVTVVIVAFNSAHVLEGCLAALPAEVPLVVVDNASRDGSADLVRRLAPRAMVLPRPLNEGLAAAANLAFARVETPYGLLLNPDTVPDAAMIASLCRAAARYPDAGLLAPMPFEPGRGLQWGRQVFYAPAAAKPPTPDLPEGDVCCTYVGGPAMFFPMAAFRRIGGFDDRLFLYYEDDDICMRMRGAGFGLVYAAEARMAHLGGQSTTAIADLDYWKNWHMAWSRARMEEKTGGRGAAILQALGTAGINLFKRLTRPGDARRSRYAGRLGGAVAWLAGRNARDVRLGPANDPPPQG